MVMTSRDEESIFWLVRCIEREIAWEGIAEQRETPAGTSPASPSAALGWVGYPFTAFLFSPPPHTLRYHCRIFGFCSIRMSGQHIKLLPSAHNHHSSQWGQQPERSSPRHCRFCRCRNIMIRFAGERRWNGPIRNFIYYPIELAAVPPGTTTTIIYRNFATALISRWVLSPLRVMATSM